MKYRVFTATDDMAPISHRGRGGMRKWIVIGFAMPLIGCSHDIPACGSGVTIASMPVPECRSTLRTESPPPPITLRAHDDVEASLRPEAERYCEQHGQTLKLLDLHHEGSDTVATYGCI
jgi:hypothetical protein